MANFELTSRWTSSLDRLVLVGYVAVWDRGDVGSLGISSDCLAGSTLLTRLDGALGVKGWDADDRLAP